MVYVASLVFFFLRIFFVNQWQNVNLRAILGVLWAFIECSVSHFLGQVQGHEQPLSDLTKAKDVFAVTCRSVFSFIPPYCILQTNIKEDFWLKKGRLLTWNIARRSTGLEKSLLFFISFALKWLLWNCVWLWKCNWGKMWLAVVYPPHMFGESV